MKWRAASFREHQGLTPGKTHTLFFPSCKHTPIYTHTHSCKCIWKSNNAVILKGAGIVCISKRTWYRTMLNIMWMVKHLLSPQNTIGYLTFKEFWVLKLLHGRGQSIEGSSLLLPLAGSVDTSSNKFSVCFSMSSCVRWIYTYF